MFCGHAKKKFLKVTDGEIGKLKFEFESITSRKNPKIIHACALSDKKNRDKEGLFTFEGEKLMLEALKEDIPISEVYFTEKAQNTRSDMLCTAAERGARLYLVTDEVYDKLTYEKASQQIFAVAVKKEIPYLDENCEESGFVVLESVRDPSNVGAILRTCAALGSDRILLTDDCADIYSYKTLRAAMGAAFKARLYFTNDVAKSIEMLKQKGKVYAAALTENAVSISETDFREDDSIVIGNEGHGVSTAVLDNCDSAVIIPMQCGSESLNASVAAAILIWEKARKTNKVYG